MGEVVGPWLPFWAVASHSILRLTYLNFYNFMKRRKENWLKVPLLNIVVQNCQNWRTLLLDSAGAAAADRYRKHFDENLLVSTVSGCWPRLPSRLVYDKNQELIHSWNFCRLLLLRLARAGHWWRWSAADGDHGRSSIQTTTSSFYIVCIILPLLQ